MRNKFNDNEVLSASDDITQNKSYAIPLSVVVFGMIIAGALIYGANGPSPKNTAGDSSSFSSAKTTEQAIDARKIKSENRPFIGNPDAPVTIAYWYDYQCPFCKRFEELTMPLLVENYILTNKVKIVFKNFQFLGQDSQIAGLAGLAVWQVAPEKFYNWHKKMYAYQDSENSGWGSKTDILKLAEGMEIDASKTDALMTEKNFAYQKILADDFEEGKAIGITGTPSSIIDKRLLIGARPYSEYKEIIDAALNTY